MAAERGMENKKAGECDWDAPDDEVVSRGALLYHNQQPILGRRYVSYVGKDPRGSLRDRSIDHLAACMRTIPRL